jgi:hypothetical protein
MIHSGCRWCSASAPSSSACCISSHATESLIQQSAPSDNKQGVFPRHVHLNSQHQANFNPPVHHVTIHQTKKKKEVPKCTTPNRPTQSSLTAAVNHDGASLSL